MHSTIRFILVFAAFHVAIATADNPCNASAVGPPPSTVVGGTTLDIHLNVDPAFHRLVLEASSKLHHEVPSDEIDFVNTSIPHITLYLTEFKNESLHLVQQTVSSLPPLLGLFPCTVHMSSATGNGTFGMWNVASSECLQRLSDIVVQYTFEWAVPNQPIPKWVCSLPPKQRQEKIEMIRKYGSPNVFSQFQPHVTLAWVPEEDQSALSTAIEGLHLPPTSFVPPTIGIGATGPHGTVYQRGGLGNYTIHL